MNVEFFKIEGPCLLTPRKFDDERGFFMETYQKEKFEKAIGKSVGFVQDNHSLSKKVGTVRGLHYQSPPYAQAKLVRCTNGSICDVAVDVRVDSPTYGQHVKVILSADKANQLWVPEGFLHGFATLEENTEVSYKVTQFYDQKSDGNVKWNDPDLGINWEIIEASAVLSEKDMNAESFKSFISPFNV